MERGNSKHGPRLDEAMDHEVRGMLQGKVASSRIEEWHDPEPSGEDQPEVAEYTRPGDPRPGGAPTGVAGTTEAELRSRLGTYLPRSVFPAHAGRLYAAAERENAPDELLDELRGLPEREYQTVAEVWQGLGGGIESHRW
jgi:hypothetical protein